MHFRFLYECFKRPAAGCDEERLSSDTGSRAGGEVRSHRRSHERPSHLPVNANTAGPQARRRERRMQLSAITAGLGEDRDLS